MGPGIYPWIGTIMAPRQVGEWMTAGVIAASNCRPRRAMRPYVHGDKRPVAQPGQEPKLDFAVKQALDISRIDRLARK